MVSKSAGAIIIMIFIGAIIAVVFLDSAADTVSLQTSSFSLTNSSVTAPATNGTLALTGRDIVGTTLNVWNETTLLSEEGNVTISEGIVSGAKTVFLRVNQNGSAYAATAVNVTYSYGGSGYLPDASSRSVAGLILLMAAIAAFIFVVVMIFKPDLFGNLIKNMRRS